MAFVNFHRRFVSHFRHSMKILPKSLQRIMNFSRRDGNYSANY